MRTVRARAPGRVNLIGDHTDYTGGLVLPLAIDRATTVVLEPGGTEVVLHSDQDPTPAVVDVEVDDPASVVPAWARYVAGVVWALRPAGGGVGTVHSDLPVGAGLGSSAALEVAVALALGFGGSPGELALICQRAEHAASGVPCGVMDQLASAAGVDGHALLIDCATLAVTPVSLPEDLAVVVVDSRERRDLARSAYSERRAQCEAAEAVIGPLRSARADDLSGIHDPLVRRRARHVVSENARVRACAEALRAGDVPAAGALLVESHASLRDDFEVSTPVLDELVERLGAIPGVYGARLTGAGFGGFVVALADPGAPVGGLRVRAAAGASLERS